MDWFLIILILVAILIFGIVGVYCIVYYQHPDDNNDAWFPKIVVLLGFILAGFSVLLVSLDKMNGAGYPGCDGYDTTLCGGLNMELFWTIIFWAIPAWVFLVIPFATFYYEADDGSITAGMPGVEKQEKKSKIMSAICYMTFIVVIVGALFGSTYYLFATASIPVTVYESPPFQADLDIYSKVSIDLSDSDAGFSKSRFRSIEDSQIQSFLSHVKPENADLIELRVKPATFYAGLMAFLGWFLFALFGGIGLAALPLDLILVYVNRPRHLDAVEFADIQTSLRQRTNELVDIGELIKVERTEKSELGLQTNTKKFGMNFGSILDPEKRKEAREERQAILGFKTSVFILDQDVQDFQNCHANYENYNPLLPYASLLLGLISIVITVCWILQIVLYVLPRDKPIYAFLNIFLGWFDRFFPLFGVLALSTLSLYLLFCCVKGCFKFGLRFVCFQLYPMEVGKTYMSAMLFNVGLVLMCTLPVIQLTQTAFEDYCKFATITQLFGVQIEYLKFFSWFWVHNIFVIAMITFFGLTALYLACKPRDKSTSSIALRDRLKSRNT